MGNSLSSHGAIIEGNRTICLVFRGGKILYDKQQKNKVLVPRRPHSHSDGSRTTSAQSEMFSTRYLSQQFGYRLFKFLGLFCIQKEISSFSCTVHRYVACFDLLMYKPPTCIFRVFFISFNCYGQWSSRFMSKHHMTKLRANPFEEFQDCSKKTRHVPS